MQYKYGLRITKLEHEMTPFERQLSQLNRTAKKYHNKCANDASINGETAAQKKQRLADRKSELAHLTMTAGISDSIASVQGQLAEYRQRYSSKNRTEARENRKLMAQEPHHPTEVLETNLHYDNRPKPTPKHTAHHIVPGTGKTVLANRARVRLHLHDIRINDPDNGVWMIRLKEHKGHWSAPNSNSHLEIHTHNYEGWVFRILDSAIDTVDARKKLRNIGMRLEGGTQPPEVTMPPNESWQGV